MLGEIGATAFQKFEAPFPSEAVHRGQVLDGLVFLLVWLFLLRVAHLWVVPNERQG
jgi:hypothetical protein